MQAEKKRTEKLNKGMAERTIDAQRVSGEQPAARGRQPTSFAADFNVSSGGSGRQAHQRRWRDALLACPSPYATT